MCGDRGDLVEGRCPKRKVFRVIVVDPLTKFSDGEVEIKDALENAGFDVLNIKEVPDYVAEVHQ